MSRDLRDALFWQSHARLLLGAYFLTDGNLEFVDYV